MRLATLALASALLPLAAQAQLAPRSLALELGFSEDSAAALGSRLPVGLVASWWLGGDLDAVARLSWASAARTEGRATYEAGLGLRYQLARWGSLRPHLALELAAVGVTSAPGWISDTGVRLGMIAGVEALLGPDLFLAAIAGGSEVLQAGGGGLGGCAALRAGAYF